MVRFIAIPVAQGDSFYLERDDCSVLVDGGGSRSGFASMFQAVVEANGVNVVVCTHNDADHAKGILGFLEAGLRCDEVWLPGRWLSALPDVLKPFPEVLRELAGDITATDTQPTVDSPLDPLETYAENMHEPPAEPLGQEEGLEQGGWPESHLQILEQAEPLEATGWIPLFPDTAWPFFPHHP